MNNIFNGFWDDLEALKNDLPDEGIETFDFMQNEPTYDYKEYVNYLSPFDFLHGFCNVFAQYLNEKYGYEIEYIKEFGSLVHAYCIYKGCFIDVRGIHTDYDEFMKEFTLNGLWDNDDDTYTYQCKKMPDSFRNDEDAYKIAKKIDTYYGYYSPKAIDKILNIA